MADNKFTFKGVADVKDVIKGIQEIQAALNKLQLKPDIKASFDRIFQNIERQAEKANTAMATGFKNRGDVKHYTDAMGQITRAYDEIILKIEKLKTQNIKFNFDTQEVTNIRQELAALEQAAQNAAQNVKAIGDALGKSQKMQDVMQRRATNTKGGQQWKDIFDNLNPDNIDKAIKKVEELQNKIDEGMNKGKAKAYWQSVQTDLNVVKGDIQQYTSALDLQSDAEEKTAQKAEQLDAALHNVSGELDAASNAAKNGSNEFGKWARESEEAVKGTQQLNSELDHFKSKTAYFFGISNAINLFKRAVRSAYNTVKDLDAIMTETAVVTNFNVGDMWSQLPEYTARANELGVTIHDTYEAATLFYQQGLKTNEVMQISNETLKMARIAGLDAATASDRMTNALRGFNMELDKTSAQRVNDVYSKLAAITASNTDEISTAMTKVASLAHNANMEFETTAAFLAQIIESTRESAETAGTALKTVVARFSEVKKLYSKGELMGQDEEGEEIDVNKVSTALRSAGINLNEYLTGAKGLDDIFIELAEKWDSLDQVQQRYIATMAAGSRQQSRFIALMSDYQRTIQLVDAANNANGASQEQYSKTLESLQTKLARLKNAWNEFILGLANSEVIKKLVDLLTDLLTTINKVISKVSGKNSIAKMITTFFTAFTAFKIGRKLFGGSTLGKFFAGLVQDASGQASASGIAVANVFYKNLSTRIANFAVDGKITKGIQKEFSDLGRSVKIGFMNNFGSATGDMNQTLWNSLDKSLPTDESGYEKIFSAFNSGKYTVGEFNQVLKAQGQEFQITKENAYQFGIAMKDDNTIIKNSANQMRTCATAAMALGGAFMVVGNLLENMDGPAAEFGTVLKYLGGGLMAFGTIMSVTLPLMAQVGAKGVSSAIYSIPIIGWITLIISLVAALAAAIYNFAKNNSAEAKLEKAAEASKEAAEAANEAREAYEKLGEAWDDLAVKNDALEEAIEGTQEWRDAVKEVNEAVIELANNYDGVLTARENGVLKITNQSEVDEVLRQRALNAEANERIAKMEELKWAQEANYETADPNGWGEERWASAIRQLEADNMLEYATDEDIIRYLDKDFEERNVNLHGEDYVDEVRAYIESYKQINAALDTQKTALAATILNNSNIDKNMQKYASGLLSNDYITRTMNTAREGVSLLSKEDLQEQYAHARGYENYAVYQSKNPDEKVKTEEMQNFVVGARTVAAANNSIQAFTNNFNKLDNTEKAYFSGTEGSALTKDQISYFLAPSVDYDVIDLYNRAGGKEVFGDLGEFQSQFYNDLKIASERFDTSDFSGVFVDNLNDSLMNRLQSGPFRDLADNLWSVYSASGKEGMNKIQDTISKMTEGMDDEELNNFISSINAINWSSADSIRTLDSLAKEYGVSEDIVNDLKNQIIELNNAASKIDFEKLGSVLGVIAKINKGEQGRSFSEEEHNNLIDYGVSEDNFKYNVQTGEYDFIGKNLQEITDTVMKNLDQTTTNLEKRIAAEDAVNVAKEKYKQDIDTEDYNDLRMFLKTYAEAAGDNSLIDTASLYDVDIEHLQDAYNMVMEAAAGSVDAQQELNQLREYAYQVYSGQQNAALATSGDEQAKDTLKQQISNSGLPQAFIESFIEAIDNGVTDSEAEFNIQGAGTIADVMKKANTYGIEADDLNTYVAALQTVDNLENARIETLYELALVNANYQEGFKNVIESYEDWIELEQEDGSLKADSGNLQQLETMEKLKKDLKQMFNLSKDVSDEFLEIPENVALLKDAVNGDTKAVAQLRAELMKTSLIELKPGLNEKGKNEIFNLIDSLTNESLDLEFGATLDDSQYASKLAQLLLDSGYTVDSINEMFGSIGWSPVVKMKAVPVTDAAQYMTEGQVEVVDPVTGQKTTVTANNIWQHSQDGMIYLPQIGEASFTPPEIPPYTPKTKSSSGGGGGGSSKKKTYWENPYDELYNLQQKINEALRTREALERRYQKLLKQEQATLADIRKSYYSQINNLRYEADLQKQFAAGRLRQINEIGNKIYTDSEGNRKSFNSLGVTKYASYNANTGLITIDWEGLEAISKDSSREEEGKAAEAYISKLEELVDSYEEVRDKLWDIEDKIEEIRDAAIDSYLSFEDRVMEAIVNDRQNQIDSYQSMSDAIEKANSEVIDSLREQIDLSRQIRDNTEKEQDIADMENRLAYLQRDTSGANALEIQKLQKDLEDARESYTDTLVDQAIDKMQNDADLAAEQRARQIETMQEQLEIMKNTGVLWDNVYSLMNEAAEGDGALSPHSNLVKLLQETEAFSSLSNIGQAKWWSEVAEEFHKAWIGLSEAEDKYKTDANNDGKINDSGTSSAIEEVQQAPATTPTPAPTTTSSKPSYDDKTKYGVALAVCDGYWGNGDARKKNLESKGFNYSEIQGIVNKVYRDSQSGAWYGKYYGIKDTSQYRMSKFKTGGLADFTGPAWLDGTKTRPELILNAQDSANFIALKDILASLLNVQGGRGIGGNGGDNYFDIDISANLGSDYDVDKLTEKIKRDIYQDGQYRNVNTINYLR